MSSNVLLFSLYSQELRLCAHPASCHPWSGCHHEPAHDFQFSILSFSVISSPRREKGGRWGGLGAKRTRLAFTEELIISKQRVTTAVLLLRAAGISGGRPPGGCGTGREKSGFILFHLPNILRKDSYYLHFINAERVTRHFLIAQDHGAKRWQLWNTHSTSLAFGSRLISISLYIFEHELNCNWTN